MLSKDVPFTITIPVIGIHSLDPSGKTEGLHRAGRASKLACTSDAIREDREESDDTIDMPGEIYFRI